MVHFGALIRRYFQVTITEESSCDCEACYALKHIESSKAMTWKDIVEDDSKQCEQEECIFCMLEYEANDRIVALKCHRNHLFHHKCMIEYLER